MDLGWISGPLVVVALVAAVAVWLRRTLDPRLVIEDATGEPEAVAAHLPSLIAEELDLLRQEGGGTSLRWAAGTDEPIALPDTLLAANRAEIATWLFALLPRPTYTFSLKLIASGVEGRPGLAVSLRAGGHQRGSIILWDTDFGPTTSPTPSTPAGSASKPPDTPAGPGERPPAAALDADSGKGNDPGKKEKKSTSADAGSNGAGGAGEAPPQANGVGSTDAGSAEAGSATGALHRLGRAAAAWLAYRLPTNDPRGRQHALLTADWQSYAHFRISATSDGPAARESLVRALKYDARNRGALHNLALHDVEQHCYGPALYRLASTVALLGDELRGFDRLWYRARFNLAAAAVNYVLDRRQGYPLRPDCMPPRAGPDADGEYVGMAVEALDDLITAAAAAIALVEDDQELTRQGICSDAALLGFLRDICDAAEITRSDVKALADAAA